MRTDHKTIRVLLEGGHEIILPHTVELAHRLGENALAVGAKMFVIDADGNKINLVCHHIIAYIEEV
jgi:hypothetical protein